ncbi:cytochrome P450 family protein [Bombardia bombarda]|uniref:Cytochrome P450 family protein n=1 Tax=Bombardia bombarda TaxID=252184 RepID=A0AA39X815_9PEZI|nr:cytochrome P450 family protein [Bombardia bombarda]
MLADWASSGLAVTLFLVFLLYRYLVYPALLSPLAQIPSAHWSSPISRLWILWIRYTHRENRTLHALHRQLGPVVRVGPNELSVDGVDSVRTVYQGGFDKPVWYSVFDNYGVPCMFSARTAAEHSARKRMITNVYSKSTIQTSPVASAQSHAIIYGRLLPLLQDSAAAHGIDMYSVFMAASMDFITAYIFGIGGATNFLANNGFRDHFLEYYKARNNYGFYDQELPQFTRFCRMLGIPFCPKWVDAANKELENWCRRLCAATATSFAATTEHEHPPAGDSADQPVVWNALVGGLSKEAEVKSQPSILWPTALSHDVDLSIASELFDHILAGQETTGLALSYLSWRVSQNLHLQAELRAELLTLTPSMQLRHDQTAPSTPDPKQLDSLPLLHAVIMETLRLHAPIPGQQPRETPQAGCQIGPYRIPGGVRIAASAYTLHRDEGVFPEPEKWDHTRWLSSVSASASGDERRRERQRQFWAFSSGGRMCIGSNFAMHEMKQIVAAIYTTFTSHIVDDAGMADQSDGYTSRPTYERLYLRFERL